MKEQINLNVYVDRLYSAAVRKTGDAYVAEDIAQETFLAALGQLSRGKRPDNVWAWLLGILSNKYCDWLREKYNKPYISFEEYPCEIAQETVPDDDSEEKLEAIRRELGYLARNHREVMVRFYMHGQTLEKIADDLQIPVGTVKSRLNMGRQHIRKGVNDMENYTKQSYEPDMLHVSCAGETGIHQEPFSLVPPSDKLAQNILILAYPKPVAEAELAKSLGVPAAFIEPVVNRLVKGELMCRTDGGKVYTDFIIYTDRERQITFGRQLATVEEHFGLFWEKMAEGLNRLREREYYRRQTEHAKSKLELHFCVKVLMNAHNIVRDEVTGPMSYAEYPYRKDGGRWIAMGLQYPADYRNENDAEFRKYGINGETGAEIRNFRDTKSVNLRIYGTALGEYPDYSGMEEHVKWFYELYKGVSGDQSAVGAHMLQEADSFIRSGILKKDGTLKLDIPVLTGDEYRDECALAAEYERKVAEKIREVLLPVFNSGYVKLPEHLKSVPKWQCYMYCGDRVPMAVIHKAVREQLFLDGAEEPIPAALLVAVYR